MCLDKRGELVLKKSVVRALSVREPYAELIMRGEKTVEYRSKPTKIRERVYLRKSPTIHSQFIAICFHKVMERADTSWREAKTMILLDSYDTYLVQT